MVRRPESAAVAVWMLLLASALTLPSLAPQAQRVLTVSSAMTTTQVPTRSMMESVAMTFGSPLPGPYRLGGVSPAGAIHLLPPAAPRISQGHAFVMSQGWQPGPTEPPIPFRPVLEVFRASPFERVPEIRWEGESGWEAWPVAVLPDESEPGAAFVAILERNPAGDRLFGGRFTVVSLHPEDPSLSPVEVVRWDLPGKPVAGALMPDGEQVAIVCAGPIGPILALASIRDPAGDFTAIEAMTGPLAAGARPTDIAVTESGHVLLLQSGFAAADPAGSPVSWLTAYDGATLEPVGDPVNLTGAATTPGGTLVSDGLDVWSTTRIPGTYFGYVTLVSFDGTGFVKTREHPLANVAANLQLAVEPGGAAVAVAMDRRLEIWPAGERRNITTTFEAPVRTVQWTNEGLLVAEAGRVHLLLSETAEIRRTVQYQTGQITAMKLVPDAWLPPDDFDGDGLGLAEELRLGSDPMNPDTDGDGVHDGIDPSPRLPKPVLEAGAVHIVFRGAAVGKELRGMRIYPEDPDTVWRIHWDREAMPWLRLQPQTGRGGGVTYMGVDPQVFPAGEAAAGELVLELQSLRPGVVAVNTPVHIPVSVTPLPPLPHRILWVWPGEGGRLRAPDDPRGYRGLAEMLAARPFYLAHDEAVAPVLEALEDYHLVILPASAAVRGALTRKAVLDFVARGGALLILADEGDANTALVLSEWLGPLGIGVREEGPPVATAAHGESVLAEAWADLGPKPQCSFTFLHPGETDEERPEQCGFVMRTYGYGRVALVGDATVLQSPALNQEHHRQFAKGMVRWLAKAGVEFNDLDGDGIPDELEDINGNGIHDPGETDFLHPDTDRDGIPDGLEDLNRNGRVDDGETDPRNPDSDGDGVWDGADHSPAPVYGAPHINYLEPSEAPAEGGITVVVSGRNLLPGTEVWFGDAPAPWSRPLAGGQLLVAVPDSGSDQGGAVTVRVANPRQAADARLPGGFVYAPRTRMALELWEALPAYVSETMLRGVVGVRLEPVPDGGLSELRFTIRADDAAPLTWEHALAGVGIVPLGRQVISRHLENGDLLVVYRPPPDAVLRSGDVIRIPWQWPLDAPRPDEFTVTLTQIHATNRAEALLATDTAPLSLAFP